LLAIAGFAYGFVWEEVQRRGVDIAIALDVSNSMLVEDADPGSGLSRLERARREIADLLDVMEGDRLALVAFAGLAYVELPLTLDYEAARLFLDVMNPDLIPVQGTAIDEAIDTSIEALDEGGGKGERALILITDGEDHSEKALEAAARAKERGIRIFPIGIGRAEGAPIPSEDGGFRRDESGEIILSRLDEPTLQRIALDTGGRYVRSVTGDLDLEQIYFQGIKAAIAAQVLGATRRQRWKDRFQWLVALALAALMAEPLVAETARRGETAA
jgi:Ca-activated chloride channel family protein